MARPSWINFSRTSGSGNGSVTYQVGENTGRNSRSGIVTYIASGVSAVQQSVNQAGKTEFAKFESATYSVTDAGGALTIKGTSNSKRLVFSISSGSELFIIPLNYTAAGQSVRNDGATDIPNDPGASEAFEFSISVTIEENPTTTARSCTFSVSIGAQQATGDSCTISQSGASASLSVSPSSISFTSDGGTQTTTVTSNVSWSIQS